LLLLFLEISSGSILTLIRPNGLPYTPCWSSFNITTKKIIYLPMTMEKEPVEEVARIPIADESRRQFRQGSARPHKTGPQLLRN
jgi:hypothetical protein